jgi:predicted ATPase/class 3 adenylate cyclase
MVTPSGVVTFLFTDVEGSTRLWAEHTDAMDRAVARHDELLRAAIDAHAGYVFATGGDGFAAAFTTPSDGVAAAIDAQRALQAEAWEGLPTPLRVRMGLHVGESHERGGDYFGPEVNVTARVMAAAWGGQVLCTGTFAARAGTATLPLGEHRLRDLPFGVALCQVVAAGLPAAFPKPRTVDVAPSTLPNQRSSFIGRRDDVEVLRRMLLDHRLITLTGPGGTGKTRLAIEVAGREAPRRSGGTYFADLSPLDIGGHVAETVARACLVPPDAGREPADRLVDHLADSHALLVLDNCEHVLDDAAVIIDRALETCPNIAVLATSREALDLPGEHRHPLGSLDPASGDAETLFVERALAAGGTVVDPAGSTISELCERLDGIPLAIELAAARTRSLTPQQVLDRLDARLDVLGARRRGSPDRHQTLRATIDWSYELLDAEERAFFDMLAVFAGTFDLDAAASLVGGDPVRAADLVDGLVAKSMIIAIDDRGRGLRFRLLESLQAYAGERLRSRPEALAGATTTHATHFLGRLGAVPMRKVMTRDLRTEFEPDLDNIRLAFERAAGEQEVETLVRNAVQPFVFLLVNMGLIAEARVRCDAILSVADLDATTRGHLLVARAYLDATEDGSSAFAPIAAEALRHLVPGDGVWSAAVGLTSIPMQMFAPADAVLDLEASRARLDDLESPDADHDRAMLDFYLGGALMNLRRFEDATAVLLRSAATLTTLEPTSLIRLWSVSGAAIGRTLLGQPRAALDLLDSVEPLTDWTDWAVEWAYARALALAHSDAIDDARASLCRIGARLGPNGPSPLVPTLVAAFGVLAALEGRNTRASRLFELLTATRSSASTASTYEVVGRLEGWSDEEFANLKLTRAMVALSRQSQLDRREYFTRLNALVREEVQAFGQLSSEADRPRPTARFP